MVSRWIVPPAEGLIEPALAPEIFASKIGGVELAGNLFRIYLVAEQLPLEAGGLIAQNVVVAKILRPIENLPATFEIMARCFAIAPQHAHAAPDNGPFTPRIVR